MKTHICAPNSIHIERLIGDSTQSSRSWLISAKIFSVFFLVLSWPMWYDKTAENEKDKENKMEDLR